MNAFTIQRLLTATALMTLALTGSGAERPPPQDERLGLRLIHGLDAHLLAGAIEHRQKEAAVSSVPPPQVLNPKEGLPALAAMPADNPVQLAAVPGSTIATISAPGPAMQPVEAGVTAAAPVESALQYASLPATDHRLGDPRSSFQAASLNAPPPTTTAPVDLGAKMLSHQQSRLLPGGVRVKYLLFLFLLLALSAAALRRFGWPRRASRPPTLRGGTMHEL